MKKLNKTQKNSEKAITLIALVITIIVLLILAGISISMLSGDNSILQKAADAKTLTGVGQEKETIALAYNSALAKKVSNGNSSVVTDSELNDELDSNEATASGNPIIVTFTKSGNAYEIDLNGIIKPSTPNDPNTTPKVSENKNKTFDTNKDLVDDYGNKITLPKGFKIIEASPNVVTAGIIIEDATYTNTIGSQFVWIPVGTGANAIKKDISGTERVEIALDRYVFEDDSYSKTGIPTSLSQEFSNTSGAHYWYKNRFTEETTFKEGSKDSYINATAKELNTFISSVNSKGGFYIGRYEARTATARTYNTSNDKTLTDSNLTQITEKQSDYVYNYVTQLQAAKLSRDMYIKDNDNKNITEFASDLMNSYAWDTSTLFLQECGEDGYSIKSSVNTSLEEKGTSTDHPCNIYDMASNCIEWITETYTSNRCTYRGGNCYTSIGYTSLRDEGTGTDVGSDNNSFRPLLYVK